MPQNNPEEYRAEIQEHEHYTPETHPEVAARLALLNALATFDEKYRVIGYPTSAVDEETAAETRDWLERIESAAQTAAPCALLVASFDIDLTLRIPEDEGYDDPGSIDPNELRRLQDQGWVVGTCSDRDPTNQRSLLQSLGVEPHFCIPKELLDHARRLLPGATALYHIGDDPRRDRDIALRSGFEHRWPHQWS